MPKFHTLTVADVRRETPDCVSIAFELPAHLQDEYRFLQGQYLTLKHDIGGEPVRRSYSICSSPAAGELRVAIKRVPDGRFSTFANEVLQPGDTLEVMTPMGNFYTPYEDVAPRRYVAFAAGSGITPVISIIKAVLAAEPHSEFLLFYGNRSKASVIFRDELDALKNTYLQRLSIHHVFSRERSEATLLAGRLSGEKCEVFGRVFFDPADIAAYYLCGPAEMTESVRDALLAMGVRRQQIHAELFTAPGQKAVAAHDTTTQHTLAATVSVVLDGNAFDFSLHSQGPSILDAALAAGADLPFACKGGVCCTCRARVTEGAVAMDVNYALEPDEVAAGYVLTCQSHPQTQRVVIDFDA